KGSIDSPQSERFLMTDTPILTISQPQGDTVMDDQGSVAPKERVNIVYRPATGDAKEEVELAFKQLVVGDFTQKEDDRQLEEIKPINVDKDNFDNVLESHKL
ncbi:Uncharacterized conserved protein UCP028301, partial [mine drainage metagenome]